MHHLKIFLPSGLFLLAAWILLVIPGLFLFFMIALFVIIIVTNILTNTSESKRYNKLEKSLPTSKISTLKEGLVEVKGIFYSENLITSHIKNRPTVYSHYTTNPMQSSKTSHALKTKEALPVTLYSERRAKTLYIEDASGRIAVDIAQLKFDTPHQDLHENNDSLIFQQEYYWDMDQEVLLIGTMTKNGFERIITTADSSQLKRNPILVAKYAEDVALTHARPKVPWSLFGLCLLAIIPLLLTHYSTLFISNDILTVMLFNKINIFPAFIEPLSLQLNIHLVLRATEVLLFIPPSITTYSMIYFICILLILMPLNILIAKNSFLLFMMRPFLLTTLYILLPSLIIFITARLFNFNFLQVGFSISVMIVICFLIALIQVVFNPKFRQSAASRNKAQDSFGLIR